MGDLIERLDRLIAHHQNWGEHQKVRSRPAKLEVRG